jgi:hypothetical protein
MALYSVGTRSCTYVNLGIGTLKVAGKSRKNSAENGARREWECQQCLRGGAEYREYPGQRAVSCS